MIEDTDHNFTLLPIPNGWEPADEESRELRAIFFCHAVDWQLRHNLFQLIAKCKDGTFGKDVQQMIQHNLNERTVAAAIKEATCTCIYCALLEQGGQGAASWLLDFILISLLESDSICTQPGSQEIIEKCKHIQVSAIISELIIRVGESFGITSESQAGLMLRELLESGNGITRELLLLSLSQPEESLQKHLQIYER